MNLMEELTRLGHGVPGADHHGWRYRSVEGGIVCHPDASRIERIKVAGDIDLVMQPGAPALWVLGMTEADVRQVTHKMLAGTLRLGLENNATGDRAVVVVCLPTLPAITHEGGGDLFVYHLDQEELFLSQLGQGSIFAHGKVGGLAVTLTGNGQVDARQLQAGVTVSALRGDGTIEVMATASASSRVNGNGLIRIHGAPVEVTAAVDGGGKIEYA